MAPRACCAEFKRFIFHFHPGTKPLADYRAHWVFVNVISIIVIIYMRFWWKLCTTSVSWFMICWQNTAGSLWKSFEYSVKYFCRAFQIFLCWNQFRITWQIVIDTQAQLRLSLMSKYPHNYLLNNWLSYKNIHVGSLLLISSEIEQPLVFTGSRDVKLLNTNTNDAFR